MADLRVGVPHATVPGAVSIPRPIDCYVGEIEIHEVHVGTATGSDLVWADAPEVPEQVRLTSSQLTWVAPSSGARPNGYNYQRSYATGATPLYGSTFTTTSLLADRRSAVAMRVQALTHPAAAGARYSDWVEVNTGMAPPALPTSVAAPTGLMLEASGIARFFARWTGTVTDVANPNRHRQQLRYRREGSSAYTTIGLSGTARQYRSGVISATSNLRIEVGVRAGVFTGTTTLWSTWTSGIAVLNPG